MTAGPKSAENVFSIAGVKLASCSAGIYTGANRNDMTLFCIDKGAVVTGIFTSNKFCAAPVTLARQHMHSNEPLYFLINAGNANAGTGQKGVEDARRLCQLLAEKAGCEIDQVIPFSTGVIGEYLPLDKMTTVLDKLLQGLSADNWIMAAEAIMTTDTVAKFRSLQCNVTGQVVSFTGIVKGAGMIKPDMATMLAFIATDVSIEKRILHEALIEVADSSFNRITVDGDTSTNDACMLVATGKAENTLIKSKNCTAYVDFYHGLQQICLSLSQAIVRDGEGATKLITVKVKGGYSNDVCLAVAYSIAHSPLVKTAFFASDANWGRILAAVGNTNANSIDIDKVTILLDDVVIVERGQRAKAYTEEQGQRVMSQGEIHITVDLKQGAAEAIVWTTDLSYDYIKINAEYRT